MYRRFVIFGVKIFRRSPYRQKLIFTIHKVVVASATRKLDAPKIYYIKKIDNTKISRSTVYTCMYCSYIMIKVFTHNKSLVLPTQSVGITLEGKVKSCFCRVVKNDICHNFS